MNKNRIKWLIALSLLSASHTSFSDGVDRVSGVPSIIEQMVIPECNPKHTYYYDYPNDSKPSKPTHPNHVDEPKGLSLILLGVLSMIILILIKVIRAN